MVGKARSVEGASWEGRGDRGVGPCGEWPERLCGHTRRVLEPLKEFSTEARNGWRRRRGMKWPHGPWKEGTEGSTSSDARCGAQHTVVNRSSRGNRGERHWFRDAWPACCLAGPTT